MLGWIVSPNSCVTAARLLISGTSSWSGEVLLASLSVFMELCFVVGVVSDSSPRPRKEPRLGGPIGRSSPTAIPEPSHLWSGGVSEPQIYVRRPTGHEQNRPFGSKTPVSAAPLDLLLGSFCWRWRRFSEQFLLKTLRSKHIPQILSVQLD